ncbi:MAG: hypothetical protein ACREJX_02220, partial [Polyangiaceae bacterium]
RLHDAIYFPTVHIHDGTVHPQDNFDHVMYLQDARYDAKAHDYDGPTSVDKSTCYVRSQDKAGTFANVGMSQGLLDGEHLLHKTTLSGMLPNKDTIAGLNLASSSGGCSRCDFVPQHSEISLGPAGLAIAGFSWVIRRRNRLAKK